MRFELGKLELFGLDLGSLWQRWWRGLNSLAPVPLADIFLRPAPRLRVRMDEERMLLEQAVSGQPVRELMQLGYSELDVLEDGSLHEQVTAGADKKLLQLDLVLPEGQVLRRKVSVPAAARGNLRQALGFQISKLTPFSREQVFYDVVEGVQKAGAGMLEAELLVVPKSFASQWMKHVSRITGLPVARLQVAAVDGSQPAVANLLGELGVPSRWGRRLNRNSGLLLLLVLSLGLAMLAPVAKLRMLVVQGKQEIVQLESRVEHVRKEWYGLQEGASSLGFMLEQHAQHGRATQVLDELTRLIPDSVYLTGLTLEKDRLEISGQGAEVVELVERLNASELFEQARFASAITRGRDNKDVFVISMQLVAQGEQQ